MKLIKTLLVTLLVTTTAFADSSPVRNGAGAPLRDLGSQLSVGGRYAADVAGRPITTLAEAEFTWQSCGTATGSTADVAIKAAVPLNRIYVTAVTCSSSDADNATNLNFKDATTVIAVGGVSQMATASDGAFTAYFNPPLRGTVNAAFNFNTAAATTLVICCGVGYISVS